MTIENQGKCGLLGKNPITLWILMVLVLILALGIRMYDLTDPPLDFHSTRQLWSAIIARGIFYENLDDAPTWQREHAVASWKDKPVIEPIMFESLVAATYNFMGREIIWIPRIYSSLFWIIGGVVLFFLARDLTSKEGAFLSLLFYLFLPFGVIASRSFQPDPLMVMLIILAWWAFHRWDQTPSWKSAIFAGLFTGFAMLVKSVAFFFLFTGMAGLVLTHRGLKRVLKDPQIWLIVILSGLPVVIYTLYGIYILGMESQFQGRFFPEMLADPLHYVRWAAQMVSVVGFLGLLLGIIGIFLFQDRSKRAFILGLWFGYFVYGLVFPYHFKTHNYYHLPLIPLSALSLSPIIRYESTALDSLKLRVIGRIGLFAVILTGIAWQIWEIRHTLSSEDYRHEPPYWEALGEMVGREHGVVALTQDYGYRLDYYGWLTVTNWPETKHLQYRDLRGGKPFIFEDWFKEITLDMDYFLVTRLKELDRQVDLKDTLYNNYAIAQQGDGFILFDLNNPLP